MDLHERMRAYLLPYYGSDLARAAGKSRWLFFGDIDNTQTYENTVAELAIRAEARKWMFAQGGVVDISARTPEFMMSSQTYNASQRLGFLRPKPHLAVENGRRVYQTPETVPQCMHCVDAHAIASFGSHILLRHDSTHYLTDFEHAEQFLHWRQQMLLLIDLYDRSGMLRKNHFADIDHPFNYEEGLADVAPPECRITLVFKTEDEKKCVKRWISKWLGCGEAFRMVDESNPEKERYVLYLIHREATKERMLDRILRKMIEQVEVPLERAFTVFMAGDSLTDLRAGLSAGRKAHVIFLLAGGSRLAAHLSPKGARAGEPFAGEKMRHLTSRLRPTERKGWYLCRSPWDDFPRMVIIADEAFGSDAVGPASLLAYAHAA